MEDKENLRKTVAANLRSVTQSCKGGVPLDRLEKDYRELLGTPIRFRDMGFSSLEAMIRSMPDVIKLSKNSMGKMVALGMADETTSHIVSLVSRQKESKARKPTFHRPYRMPATRGPPWHRSPLLPTPLHSKRFQASPSTRFFVQKNSQRAYSDSSSRLSHATADTRRAPPKKETAAKSNFEVPPRFLRSQKNDPSPASVKEVPDFTPSQQAEPFIMQPLSITTRPSDFQNKPLIKCDAGDQIPSPKQRRGGKVKRTVCLTPPALPIQISAKQFVAEYAAMNNIVPKYQTKMIGQKKKNFISILHLGSEKYNSYPNEGHTEEHAEEIAANEARKAIESRAFESKFEETKIDTVDEVLQLVARIEEIVTEKPNGVWSIGVPKEYEIKYSESLPPSWLTLMKEHAFNSIEFTVPDGIQVPKDACILRVLDTLSGTTTPTSTSSRTSFSHDDDTLLDLNQKTLRMAFQGVPRLVLPSEDDWEVFVTTVTSTMDIAVNLVHNANYSESFFNEMTSFYEAHNLPAQKVLKKKLYATCDGGYFRVRVEDVSTNSDLVTCYFVDRGDTRKLHLSELQELDPSFENLAFQAIHLRLHGLEDYVAVINSDLLERHLLAKSLIAKIVKSGDGWPFVVLYDTSGEDDINMNELLRQEALCELLAAELPPVGSISTVYLTHVTPDGEVYLRPSNPYFRILEDELEKLTSTFELSGSSGLDIDTKALYAAKYADGMWYRAALSEAATDTADEVEVMYVDYGNTSWVPLSSLCKLEPISKILASLPRQALACSLSEVPLRPTLHWTEEAAKKLYELVLENEELMVKVEQSGSEDVLPRVSLFKRNEDSMIISINQTLAFNTDLFRDEHDVVRKPPAVVKPSSLLLSDSKEVHSSSLSSFIPDVAVHAAEVDVQMAKRQSSELNAAPSLLWTPTPEAGSEFITQNFDEDDLPPLNIPDSGLFDVYVTLAASPSNFVVQPMQSANELQDLQDEMQQFYSLEENLCELHAVLLKEENLFAALNTDNIWYRVRLKEVHGDPVRATVHFIDYGDYNVVTMANLQRLYNRFKKLPAQAIKASLAGVKPKSQDWNVEECVSFQERVKEKSFFSNVKKKCKTSESDLNNTLLHLELIDTEEPDRDVFIHKELIEKGIALPT